MTCVMVAHIISVNWDLGQGMKSIMKNISTKLGKEIKAVNTVEDTVYVREELNDFNLLADSRSLENKVRYNYNGVWMSFTELLELLVQDDFFGKSSVLQKQVEISGMTTEEYINMVVNCSKIRKKYIA